MTLISLTIPEAPAQLTRWLESQLVGLHLGELAAELAAVHSVPGRPGVALDDLLGDQLPLVLTGGLGCLPVSALRSLLVQPRLLLQLQERILTEGGEYWDQVAAADQELPAAVERGRQELRKHLASRPPQRRYRLWIMGLAAAAALVLIMVFVAPLLRPGGPAPVELATWGWSKPGALPQDGTAGAYLNHLADAAEAWFNKRPQSKADVDRRIAEFRQGCDVLLQAEHRPLAAADRTWLQDRCRAWAQRFDEQRAALQAGRDPVLVRDEMDGAVRKLMDALRTRSKTAS